MRPIQPTESDTHGLSRPALLALWIASLALLLCGLGSAPVRRTQEARVLETAREMVGEDFRRWLIPHLNGRVRLEKPPLAYWLVAASFSAFGISDFAGRLPNVLAGWLTLGLTYLIAKRLFGQRAGLLSGVCLFASYYFVWDFRLAETDALATSFVTAGVYFVWRFVEFTGPVDGVADPVTASATPSTEVRDAHVSALAIALAILAKGPPAAFIVLFFVLLVAVERRWRKLWDWCLAGAPLTVAVIALPWFLYIHSLPQWPIVREELRIALRGEEHRGAFYMYFPQSLMGAAPWSGFLLVALLAMIARCRGDPRLRGILCWIAAIFVPLCLAGQKQPHYLLPLLPALAVASGWLIDLADSDRDLRGIARIIFIAAACGVIACSAVVFASAWHSRHTSGSIDYALAAGAALTGTFALIIFRRRGVAGGAMTLGALAGAMLIVANAWWLPTLYPTSPRTAAAAIRQRFGDGPYCFFGTNHSLPLVWEMRGHIPVAESPAELAQFAREHPSIIAIAQEKNDVTPPPPPAGFIERDPPVAVEEQRFHLYAPAMR